MSEIVTDAAVKAVLPMIARRNHARDVNEALDCESCRNWAIDLLAAAAPLIAAQVRESVAREIECAKADPDTICEPGHYSGLAHAARIAREGK